MASFSAEDFQKLKEQVELLGLDENQKNKFILEEWRRMKDQEAAAEERKLATEVEEQKLAAEAEERKVAAKTEERKLAAEAEERKLAAVTEEQRAAAAAETEEKKALREFEFERMRLELEAKRLDAENQGATQGRIMPARVKSPDLPSIIDGKDDLDSYLLRFEIYATVAKWEEEIWATQLSALLSGKRWMSTQGYPKKMLWIIKR